MGEGNYGHLWTKTPTAGWKDFSVPSVRTSSGFKKAKSIWKKTTATDGTVRWSEIWWRDLTPPAPAVSLTLSINSSAQLVVTSKASADNDIVSMHWAWSTTAYPTTPPTVDGTSIEIFACAANQTITKTYGSQVSNRTYYWVCWVRDSVGNFSVAKMAKFNTGTLPAQAPAVINKSGYFLPTDSGSWNDVSDYWRTDNDYVYQGGPYWHGFWFYSTGISAALAKAKSITLMKIVIARVNSVHGVSGEANVWLTAHTLPNQITGNPNTHDTPGVKVGTLARGETGTFTVPSGWYDEFLAKKYVGFGLYYGETSYTDSNYMYAYGDDAGNANGRVYIEWTE